MGKLEKQKTYRTHKVLVWQYKGIKYPLMSDNAKVEEVADIGEVLIDEETENGGEGRMVEGEIIVVLGIDNYTSSVSCKGKVEVISDVMGACVKCGAKVKLSRCSNSVKATFVAEYVQHRSWNLSAFNNDSEVLAILSSKSRQLMER